MRSERFCTGATNIGSWTIDQSDPDLINHFVQIAVYDLDRKTERLDSEFLPQRFVTDPILDSPSLVAMRPTINFNDQPFRGTPKISNPAAKDCLAPEAESQARTSKATPECGFAGSRI